MLCLVVQKEWEEKKKDFWNSFCNHNLFLGLYVTHSLISSNQMEY